MSRRQALAAGFALAAAAAARPAYGATEPAWIDQRRIGPFVCRATFPLSDRLLADADLAGLELELRRVLGLPPCQEEVELVLLSDAREHKRLIAARLPAAPYRRALFYKLGRRAVIYAYLQPELAIDLRHEGTHALLHADLPRVPLWLDEGLAEYFEPRAELRAVGPDHLERVVHDSRAGRMRPLAELERTHDLAAMSEAHYRDAWAWTHFLLHGPSPASQLLWDTLAALRRSEAPAPLAPRVAAAFGPPERALAAHFAVWPGVLEAAGRGVPRR